MRVLKKQFVILLPILLWGVFFHSIASANASQYKELAASAKWQNLLHYQSNFWGDTSTRVDKNTFFFSKEGHQDELGELKKTIEVFNSSDFSLRQNWVCKFPARYTFLKNQKLINKPFNTKAHCPKLNFFRDQLSSKSISMIFSSYYVNTPASAFGHTLMRFNKSSAEEKGSELLDRAINYAATVTTNNSFIYAVLGMSGGFYGEFSMLPYFYKLREYNDFESRDLWSYELNLTPEQISFLIDHLWEMKQTLIRYFYLDENCSYYMLALLDAVNPEWKLTAESKFYVAPGDTILDLNKVPGLVKRVSYRPSLRKKIYKRYTNLSKKELQAFKKKDIKGLNDQEKVNVIDMILDDFDYNKSYKVLTNEDKVTKDKFSWLLKRSKISMESRKVDIKQPVDLAPHNAHNSARIRMSYDYHQRWKSGVGLELRYALHDKSDPPRGYTSEMEIEFVKTKLTFTSLNYKGLDRRRFVFDGIDLVRVASHNPYTRFFKDFSWEFQTGIKSLEEFGADFKIAPELNLLVGYHFSKGRWSTGFFGKGQFQASSIFDKAYTFRLGVQWQLNFISRHFSSGLKLESLYFLPEESSELSYRAEAFASIHLSKNIGLFTKWDWSKAEAFNSQRNRYSVGLSLYY